jgi:PST family polysaccharide transporter
MIAKIKSFTNGENKKQLLSNFFYLSVLQGANYLLPLLTVPYLIQILGMEHFGLLAFAGGVIAYFQIITNYGFNLTATKEISIHRDDKAKVTEIFSSVMIVKLILMIASFVLLSLLVFSFEKFRDDALIYLLTFGTVIGDLLFPVWFFQGMERMKYITYLNVLSKLIFTIAIFIFIKQQSDYYLVPVLTSIGFIIAGIWSLVIIKKDFGIWFEWQTISHLKSYLDDGKAIFLQQFYVSLYSRINIIFLGMFTNNTIVGYYSVVEKILAVPMSLFLVAVQAYYPYSAKAHKESAVKFFSQLKKLSFALISASLLFILIVFIFDTKIIEFITGHPDNKLIVNVLNIMIVGILFSSFGQLYTQTMIIIDKAKILNKISFIIMIFNLVFSPIVIIYFGILGLAYLILLRQLIVTVTCFLIINKHSKHLQQEGSI